MYSSTLSSTSALDGGGWSKPSPGLFNSGKDSVPIVKEDGWVPTGIRFPDRPALL